MKIMIQHISSFQDFNAFMMKKYGKLIDFDIKRFPESETEEANVYLYRVKVVKNKRRRGLGTQFMGDLCLYADFEKISLRLTPKPLDDEVTQNRLEKFYRRFGFRKMCKSEVMKRLPKKLTTNSFKRKAPGMIPKGFKC